MIMGLFTGAVFFLAFIKTLNLLRFNEELGYMVQLVKTVFKDMYTFSVFFISWMILFSVLYACVGIEVQADDYPKLHISARFFL